MDKLKLTKTAVEKIPTPTGKQIIFWDGQITGFGVRVSPGGAKTFFYQGRFKRETFKKAIGKLGQHGLTAELARKKALQIEAQIRLGQDPRISRDKSNSNFSNLMTAYVDLLKQQGKPSARAVENAIKKDIENRFPRLWKKPASEITLDDCISIVGTIKDEGKPRQADKIRSYIRTAFSEAINARGDVNMPQSMRSLNLKQNPASVLKKVKGSSQAKDRALSLAEFRAYWRHIQELPEPQRSLAMLHVLTGGQRQKQLSRVTFADIDRDAPSMTIMDGKGRRTKPRIHIVPLLAQTLDLIDGITSGPYVFSCNGGTSPVHDVYLNDIAKSVCAKMAAADELEKEPFTAGTIRATIESRLIAKPYRVSSDVLAHLLSHGMGGVQQKHYQHHDFFDEKLEALEKLDRMLHSEAEPAANVLQFEKRTTA